MKGALSFFLFSLAASSPTVYFIRHGEKPDDGNGLSAQGEQRAQCLRSVFGPGSQYNIGHIMAQTPKSSAYYLFPQLGAPKTEHIRDADGKRQRPLDTVQPVAADLGLTVDISCDRDDPKCVKKVVKKYKGEGNILICWEHNMLTDLAEELGAENAGQYPDDRFDLIWTLPPKYTEITSITSEHCQGLDN